MLTKLFGCESSRAVIVEYREIYYNFGKGKRRFGLDLLVIKYSWQMIILIVDDDAEDIELFTEAVRVIDETIGCVEAYNGLEALKILKRNALLPNFIFLDINMPLMNGRKCLEEIKSNANYRHIPVIIYSTTTDKKQIEECRRLGADFLTKPNSFDELIKALKLILKSQVSGLR
jgi:CheY-like chemotaxis protein